MAAPPVAKRIARHALYPPLAGLANEWARRLGEPGAFVIFPTQKRPVLGARGYYRTSMRHGVATVQSGERVTLGVIFHDAS